MAIPDQYNAWTKFTTEEPYCKFFENKKQATRTNTAELQRQTYVAAPAATPAAAAEECEAESEPTETPSQKTRRQKSELSQFHAKYTRMLPSNMSAHFKAESTAFADYHRVRDANFANYAAQDKPYMRIAAELRQIKGNRKRTVVDMGCGLAHLSAELADDARFRFINYDHVALENENVIACDIAHVPLEDAEVDVCVLSFALWGPSCADNLTEAMRILDTGGRLYLIDSTRHWSVPDADTGIIVEGSEGERLVVMIKAAGFEIVKQNADKYCMFVCYKP